MRLGSLLFATFDSSLYWNSKCEEKHRQSENRVTAKKQKHSGHKEHGRANRC